MSGELAVTELTRLAEGLRRLLDLGLPSSPAFALVGADTELSDAEFAEVLRHYEALGGIARCAGRLASAEQGRRRSPRGVRDGVLSRAPGIA